MKAQIRLAEKAIEHVAGSDVLPIYKALKEGKPISEIRLAKKVNQEINHTRNMLYRLYQANLVSFTKKKDKEKGWYVYYWSIRNERVRKLIDEVNEEKENQIKEHLENERGSKFFRCNIGCTRVPLEEAIEFEFRCPECGELMGNDDNGRKIIELENELKTFKRESVRKH